MSLARRQGDYVAVHGAVDSVAALERRLEVWETEAIAEAAWLSFLQAWRANMRLRGIWKPILG